MKAVFLHPKSYTSQPQSLSVTAKPTSTLLLTIISFKVRDARKSSLRRVYCHMNNGNTQPMFNLLSIRILINGEYQYATTSVTILFFNSISQPYS